MLKVSFFSISVTVKPLIAGILRYIIEIFSSQEFLLLIIVILHRNLVQTRDTPVKIGHYSTAYRLTGQNDQEFVYD